MTLLIMQRLFFIQYCKAKNFTHFIDHYSDILAYKFNFVKANLFVIIVNFKARVQVKMNFITDIFIMEDSYIILILTSSIH